MKPNHLARLKAPLVALLLTSVCFSVAAQDSANTSAQDNDSSSREVDINEDNYRRFMELKDPRLERPAFPTAKVRPNAGLEKMSQLPEASQKHLRNELREIISATGPWTPAERQRSYRFRPSEAAQKDNQLLRQEMDAWVELVGEYHTREEAIMNGRLAGDQNAPQDGSGLPSMGAGRQGQRAGANAGSSAAPESQSGSLAQNSNPGQASGANPGQPGQQGLQEQQGQQGQQGQEGPQGQPGQQQGEGSGAGAEGSAAQQGAAQSSNPDGQESASNPQRRRVAIPDTGSDYSAPEPETSNAGVSQSALEFLAVQGRVTIPEAPSTPPVETPNPKPPATQAAPPAQAPVAGTLTLEELRNARGLSAGQEAGAAEQQSPAEAEPVPDADDDNEGNAEDRSAPADPEDD